MDDQTIIAKRIIALSVVVVCSLAFVLNSFGDELLPLPAYRPNSVPQQSPPIQQQAPNVQSPNTYISTFRTQVSQLTMEQLKQLKDGIDKLLKNPKNQSEKEFYLSLIDIINAQESALRNASPSGK